jgi:hypothetical protein
MAVQDRATSILNRVAICAALPREKLADLKAAMLRPQADQEIDIPENLREPVTILSDYSSPKKKKHHHRKKPPISGQAVEPIGEFLCRPLSR